MTSTPDPEVFVGIASVGTRADLLEQAVASLIDQVDCIGVYLNNYEMVPAFLEHPRIMVARSQDHGDLRDNGKFFFLDECRHRFYAAADDDISYPDDYILRLKAALAKAGPGAAVGVHGAVYPNPVLGLSRPRHLYHFLDPLPYVMPVHLLGTGTVLFDQREWQLRLADFGEPGMADVWFARNARSRRIRLFAINRDRDWLTDLHRASVSADVTSGARLFAEAKADDSRQVALLQEGRVSEGGFERHVRELAASEVFLEELSLSQVLALDTVRRAVGWRPLSPDAAQELRIRLEKCRSRWNGVADLDSDIDIDAYSSAAVSLLAGDLPADVASRTLSTLDVLERLRDSDNAVWKRVPSPLRLDTRPTRAGTVKSALLRRSFLRSPEDALHLWPRMKASQPDLSPDVALTAEEAGIDTAFQHLPALQRNARKNPLSAALDLRAYLEQSKSVPDSLAWRKIFGAAFWNKEIQLLLGFLALKAGAIRLARATAESLFHRWPLDIDIRLVKVLVEAAIEGERSADVLSRSLQVLDEVVQSVGLRAYTDLLVDRRDSAHWIRRLTAAPPSESTFDRPSVTVIMTVYNNVDTVTEAISSVLAARDVDLELIVVDDASNDGTQDVLGAFKDGRIRVITNSTNVGPYLSRNRALELATGEFVTIADADDWSHPDRLRFQVERLTAEPYLVACTTAHVRIRPDGSPDLENNLLFIGHGPVSLMFRRSIVEQVGGFDHVRTRGDIEFIRRLQARFGTHAVGRYDVPLILATSSVYSNSKRFDTDSLRRYRQSMREWHADNAMSDVLYVPLRGTRAGFVAPEELTVVDQR